MLATVLTTTTVEIISQAQKPKLSDYPVLGRDTWKPKYDAAYFAWAQGALVRQVVELEVPVPATMVGTVVQITLKYSQDKIKAICL